MSVYTDWTPLSRTYDKSRPPCGAHLYLGLAYSQTGKPAQHLNILDAGCGTGNHAKYLLDRGLGKITMLDANAGMMEKSKEKLQDYVDQGKVEFILHDLPKTPCSDGQFDVVMFNQVLHHLTTQDDTEHKVIKDALTEAYRLLKSPGLLIVGTCSPYQILNGFWYAKMIPAAIERQLKRVPGVEEFKGMVERIGYRSSGSLIETQELVSNAEHYYNEASFLDETWCKSNSVLADVEPAELQNAQQTVRNLIEAGEMRQFIQKHDELRPHIGQYTVLYAVKDTVPREI